MLGMVEETFATLGDGRFTLNPHEVPNHKRQYDRIEALLRGRSRDPV